MLLMKELIWNDSSLLATLATEGYFFMGKIPKRPLNGVIYTFGCFYVFHKTLSVICVIWSFRSQVSISSDITSRPIFCDSEQETQN